MAAPSSTETREFLSCACTCAPYWPEEELNGESSFHPEKVTNSKDYEWRNWVIKRNCMFAGRSQKF